MSAPPFNDLPEPTNPAASRPAPPGRGDGLARLPGVRAAIEEGIAQGLHLGAQIFVSRGGETLADAAVGEDRPGEPLTPDHLMLWLSATKPVAAVALAILWERGLVEIDDPVARHIPEFASHGKGAITLRHVLTHTGGFRLLGVGFPDQPWEEIVARIAAMRPEPRWVPGAKAGYHHASSWFILGEVIHRLDGRSFSAFAREEILAPLGMEDSWIGMPAARYHAYRAAGRLGAIYDTEGGLPAPHDWTGEAWATGTHPGGNGFGPMRQLGRLYEMLLARGRTRDPRAAAIVSPQTVEALTARHRAGMYDHTFRHILDWGLGFIINSAQYGADTVPYGYGDHASPRTFGHSGYRSSTAFADPEHALAVALTFNGTPSEAAHERRLRRVLDALYQDLGLAAAATPAQPAKAD